VSFQYATWDLEKEGGRHNILIFRTITDKYLSQNRSKVYWIFVELQKAFDTVVREVEFVVETGEERAIYKIH
jgi:hypothetical protein